MTNEEKALLDMISFAEGTLGISNNGYDVIVGYKVMQGWTTDTSIVHGNTSWYNKSANSTAAGRYQFTYDTWVGLNSNRNIAMTKSAQNSAGVKLINQKLVGFDKSKLTDYNTFIQATDKLATVWASIPLSRDIVDSKGRIHKAGKSYYVGDGVNSSRVTLGELHDVYIAALKNYSGG